MGKTDLRAVTLTGREGLVWRESGDVGLQDVFRDGRVLISREEGAFETMGLAPGAVAERSLSWLDWSVPQLLSEDGHTLVLEEQSQGAGTSYGIYVRDTAGSPAVRLGSGHAVALSPDGKWVLGATPESSLTLIPVGAGMPRKIPPAKLPFAGWSDWSGWFLDGDRVLLSAHEPDRGDRLYALDLSRGNLHAVTAEGVSAVGDALSPDAKLVAARGPSGQLALYPVQGGEPRPVPGVTASERVVRWTADGRGLYVVEPRIGATRPVHIVDIATGRRTLWKELAPADRTGVDALGGIQISRDGKSYVYGYSRTWEDLFLVEGLK